MLMCIHYLHAYSTIHSTQYTVHSTQYSIHSTQYAVHSTQYTVHNTKYEYTVRSTQGGLGPPSRSSFARLLGTP